MPIGAHEAHPIGDFEEQQLPAELHVSHGCTGPVIVAMGDWSCLVIMGDFNLKNEGILSPWWMI